MDLIVTHAIVLGGCRYCMSQESLLHKCYNEAIFSWSYLKICPRQWKSGNDQGE